MGMAGIVSVLLDGEWGLSSPMVAWPSHEIPGVNLHWRSVRSQSHGRRSRCKYQVADDVVDPWQQHPP